MVTPHMRKSKVSTISVVLLVLSTVFNLPKIPLNIDTSSFAIPICIHTLSMNAVDENIRKYLVYLYLYYTLDTKGTFGGRMTKDLKKKVKRKVGDTRLQRSYRPPSKLKGPHSALRLFASPTRAKVEVTGGWLHRS